MDISTEDYERFCRYLESASGITLGANKGYLIRSRLSRIMEEVNAPTLGALLNLLDRSSSASLKVRVIDAMTTNETLWFRDEYPFEILKDTIFPEIGGPRGLPVRIWSAASSSGQEAYSVSMTVSEYQQARPGTLSAGVQILGTDIAPSVLRQAREGVYDELEINRGLSAERRSRFFTRDGAKLRVREELKARVEFRECNLLQAFSMLGPFDVVFCRNVLIYFSNDNKRDILARIAKTLKPKGYLFLGGSEPLASYSQEFEMVRCPRGVVYRLRG
ncbi:MAG: protein-glutamate O-methyltransferase CheR [Gammaproteobacteria bacterium]|nr:protein-glutamate O-methyltransferase CheR [Gammaproteobacteria bacterium]MCG3143527.1 Chemotaxis protein methyltransferase 1 [Gammaproteobacteria bacterium]